MRLVAKYEIPLQDYLLVTASKEQCDNLRFKVNIDEFDVEIILILDKHCSAKRKSDKHHTYGALQAQLYVGREESEAPPYVEMPIGGGLSGAITGDYLIYRFIHYEKAAIEALNRLVRYFKYKLWNPFTKEFSTDDVPFNKPIWIYNDKKLQGIPTAIFPSSSSLAYLDKFSIRGLADIDAPGLQSALSEIIQPELYEEMLLDSSSAILQENYRRAVLEMAIACEIMTKQKFFGSASTSGAVFEYLETKRKLEVSVIELLHGAAKFAFGKSFKEEHPDDYKHLDHLFRTRNKVAHIGQCKYKDDQGDTHEVNEDILVIWWQSIAMLINWLRGVQCQGHDT